jgi:hypothetical protein
MAYQKFTDVNGPDGILSCISEAAAAAGWGVVANCIDDLPLDGGAASDGKKLILKSPDSNFYVNCRSANGKKIFPQQNLDAIYGVGMTCSTLATANPPSGLWYDQDNVPKLSGTSDAVGVGLPAQRGRLYNVYVNIVNAPTPLIMVSAENGGVFQHLAAACLQKLGDWSGGAAFSGSRNSYLMGSANFDPVYLDTQSLPLFGTSENANTFLRADIDAAPLRNPPVYWASAGAPTAQYPCCYTGKQLATPIKRADPASWSWDGKVPHYRYLQSQSATDTGRDVNTLNCISVNLPILLYVLRDPDGRRNFSPMGYVPGVFFISTRNVAPGELYEIKYPQSGNLHQVFPMARRRGVYGFDGLSVQQNDSEEL